MSAPQPDGYDEAIPPAGNRRDRPLALEVRIQDLAKGEYLIGDASFLDVRVRPDAFEQLVFRDDVTALFHQQAQNLVGFRSQRDELAGAVETAFRHVQGERAEFVVIRGRAL